MPDRGMMRVAPTVSPGAARMGALLAEVALASARDLVPLRRHNVGMAHQWLNELERAGLVEKADLGWTRRASGLHWLTEDGIQQFGAWKGRWHSEAGRCRLLDVLPHAEQFYRVVGEVKEVLGQFMEFHWLDGVGIDAAARYEGGWVALDWSGVFETESDLVRRIAGLGEQMAWMSLSGTAWPSLFCYVVSDAWQGQLVHKQWHPLEHPGSVARQGLDLPSFPGAPGGYLEMGQTAGATAVEPGQRAQQPVAGAAGGPPIPVARNDHEGSQDVFG